MSLEMTKAQIEDRLAKYYAWKLVIEQAEKIFLPQARQVERDFEGWCGTQARSGTFDLGSNFVIAMARARCHHIETGLRDLRGRFVALFGRHRLPTS